MKKHFVILFVAGLLAGCGSAGGGGGSSKPLVMPTESFNVATTRSGGGFTTKFKDARFGGKLELLAARKSKAAGGNAQVQWDLRNGTPLLVLADVSWEWVDARGAVTEGPVRWTSRQFESGGLTTLTATARRASSVECRLSVIPR